MKYSIQACCMGVILAFGFIATTAYADPAWTLSSTTYASIQKTVEAKTQGAFFKSDGTVLYVAAGDGSPLVRQYPLTTAWNLSTLGATTGSFSLSGSSAYWPQGLFFSSDGTRMYVASDYSADKVFQYTLSSAWDITTASYVAATTTTVASNSFSSGLHFKSDGTKMFVSDSGTERVYQFTLSSAWDITTATYDNVNVSIFSLFSVSDTTGIFFKDDGTKLLFVGKNGSGSAIAGEVALTNAWDLSATGATDTLSISSTSADPRAVAFGDAGTKLYVSSGFSSSVLRQYTVASTDTTFPTVSLSAPTASSSVRGASVSLVASTSDDVSVAGVKFYVDNTLTGSEDTSSPYAVTWDSTAVADGTHTAFAVARDSSSNYATSTSVSFTVDNTAPTISSVATGTTATSATITWTTNEAASTKVNFGITTSLGTSTAETDTSSRVTSHSVTITSLKACARYYYEVYSADTAGNSATSTVGAFRTSGCTGSAAVSQTSDGTITTASGGTLTQTSLTLTVPTSFTATSSSAVFQAHKLDADTFFTTAGTPGGKSRIGSNIFTLMALTDTETTLTTFSNPITVTLTYTSADVSGYDESSLQIYRYDDSSWSPLSSCSVDTSARTVSCTTTHFSDFGIFGDTVAIAAASEGVTSSGYNPVLHAQYLATRGDTSELRTLLEKQVAALRAELAEKLAQGSGTAATRDGLTPAFTRDLWLKNEGEDVRALQMFLIAKGYTIRAGATGYFGEQTREALERFQRTNNVTPFSGYFGPKTRTVVKY